MTYLFIWWDGIGFFGFDDAKLERIRRKPAGWLDKYKSVNRMILFTIAFFVLIYILVNEISKLGQ